MSSHAAPRTGQFQSQSSAVPSDRTRMLSSRTSVCTTVSPPVTSAKPAARAAASSACSAKPSRWVSPGAIACTRTQWAGHSASSVATGSRERSPGTGVSVSAIAVVIASAAARSDSVHGRPGGRAATYSMPRTTQSSPSWTHCRRGAGAAAGTAASFRASSRYDAANIRCAFVDAALTKCRVPSAQVSTDANPGVKPPSWDCASTTGEPQRRSTIERMWGGRCTQSRRRAVRPCGIVVGITRPSLPTGRQPCRPDLSGRPDRGSWRGGPRRRRHGA